MKTIKLFISLLLFGLIFTSCTHEDEIINPPPSDGDFAKGGIMFNKFWSEESGFDQNDPNIAKFDASPDFFRCKQCHGWDGLGNQGAYIDRAPNSARPNVTSINLYQMGLTESAEEIFEELKESEGRRDINADLSDYDPETNNTEGDKMPNFSQILTDDQIWDLVKFIKEGIFDVRELYDAEYTGFYPTGSKNFSNIGLNGNASNGNAYYADKCAVCHGADGTQIELHGGATVGSMVRSDPDEVQHIVKYGELGEPMIGDFDITIEEMKDLYKALADETNFPDRN
jgi:mono/diheme cytochrome c family protein